MVFLLTTMFFVCFFMYFEGSWMYNTWDPNSPSSHHDSLKGKHCFKDSFVLEAPLIPLARSYKGVLIAQKMCRGGLRIVGLITRGQVLDWCPPAVLFYPIRNSICCPTQLLSGHTPHPHRWEHCVSMCAFECVTVRVFAFVAAFYANNTQRKKVPLTTRRRLDAKSGHKISSQARFNLRPHFLNPPSFLYTQTVTPTVPGPLIKTHTGI